MGPLFFGGGTRGATRREKGKDWRGGEDGGRMGARSRPRNNGGKKGKTGEGGKKREAAGNLGDCWRLLLPMGLRRKGG